MYKFIKKVLITLFFTVIFILVLKTQAKATVTLSVTPSTKEVEPGKTFSITVKVSGGAGQISLSANNGTLSKTSTGWLDNSSETISCTAGSIDGSTITITASGLIGDYETELDVTKSASTTVSIKTKQIEESTTTTPTTSITPTTPTKTSTNTTTKASQTTTTQQTVTKNDDFYISKIVLKGIKENGEQVEISLSPEFSKDVYEYSCNVESNIEKIELEKEAGEYTNSIIVTGLEELKDGENIIKLQLSAENHESKNYTIKVIKEEKTEEVVRQNIEENIEKNEENIIKENKSKKEHIISMPIGIFIIIQITIIIVEVIIIKFIPWEKFRRIKKIDY